VCHIPACRELLPGYGRQVGWPGLSYREPGTPDAMPEGHGPQCTQVGGRYVRAASAGKRQAQGTMA
jgi:hypothetical protein